jgi:hypothetical protein
VDILAMEPSTIKDDAVGPITIHCELLCESSNDALEIYQQLDNDVQSWNTAYPASEDKVNVYSIQNASSNIPLFGFKTRVGLSANALFEFITSLEGYIFLDPLSDPADFNQPILGPFMLSKNDAKSKMQIEYAAMNLLIRDFLVLNVHDYSKRQFFSTSVRYSGRPGSSGFNGDPIEKSGSRTRVTNLSAYTVTPINESECLFQVYQFTALNGWFPPAMSSFGTKNYVKQLLERVQETFPIN